MKPTIQIDGSYGEGGGQILRTSLSLAAITRQAVEIVRVRSGRTKPGLQPQHLAAVQAVASLCGADLTGAEIGSTHLLFIPQAAPAPGSYHFAIGTAGAAPLVMQTVLLPLALAASPSQVTVSGGTHVPHAPTTEYLTQVFGRFMGQQGLRADFHSASAGFFPRGGGTLQAEIKPSQPLQPADLVERGSLQAVTAHIVTAQLPAAVAERGAATVQRQLRSQFREINILTQEMQSSGPSAAITVVAECGKGFAGGSAIGARGKPMEQVAEEACRGVLAWWKSGAACDEHLADQLALPMALVHGKSQWTTAQITDHLRTVLWVLPHFLPVETTLTERSNGSGLVTLLSRCPV